MSNSQKEHYQTIHQQYVDHYFDETAMAYRDKFIYRPMFRDVDSRAQLRVLELASSSGDNSVEFLKRFPNASISGCDISASACQDYRKKLDCPCHETNLTEPGSLKGAVGDNVFDVLFVVGGVHHCVSSLESFFQNARDVLKPGGLLIMYEPNKDAWYESLRKIWYRLDRKNFVAESEHALSAQDLYTRYGSGFSVERLTYFGGPAYFLILNSLILRVPLSLKRLISPPLLVLESVISGVLGRRTGAVFVTVWRFGAGSKA